MEEEWREVNGYKWLYEVSNYGGVRRKKPLFLRRDKNGYLSVCLSKQGLIKRFRVHRLVAEAFLKNPDNKKVVNHKDGNRSNNIVTNLEWVTQSENIIHAIKYLGRLPPPSCKGKFGKDHNRSKAFKIKFPSGEVRLFFSGLEFHRETGLDHTSISYARMKGMPYAFKRGGLKGYILME